MQGTTTTTTAAAALIHPDLSASSPTACCSHAIRTATARLHSPFPPTAHSDTPTNTLAPRSLTVYHSTRPRPLLLQPPAAPPRCAPLPHRACHSHPHPHFTLPSPSPHHHPHFTLTPTPTLTAPRLVWLPLLPIALPQSLQPAACRPRPRPRPTTSASPWYCCRTPEEAYSASKPPPNRACPGFVHVLALLVDIASALPRLTTGELEHPSPLGSTHPTRHGLLLRPGSRSALTLLLHHPASLSLLAFLPASNHPFSFAPRRRFAP